jgi:O-antigen ligase
VIFLLAYTSTLASSPAVRLGFTVLLVISLLLTRFSLGQLTFSAVAALASGYPIRIAFFYLSLTEIFLVAFVMAFFLRRNSIRLNRFTVLTTLLLLVAVVSVLFSDNPAPLWGMILRYAVVLTAVLCLSSLPADRILLPLFHGLCALPLTVLCNLAGMGALINFLTFNRGAFGIVVGSHVYVIFFAFIIPLLLHVRASRVVIGLSVLLLTGLIVFSHSRSLVIGAVVSCLLYFVVSRKQQSILGALALVVVLGSVIFGVAALQYFSFSTEAEAGKGISNLQRLAKVSNSVDAFLEKPLLGHGFGVSGADKTWMLASDREEAVALALESRFNPEFMPLQVLVEVGIIGGVLFLFLSLVAFQHTLRCLRLDSCPVAHKSAVAMAFGVVVVYAVNSNSFASPFIYMLMYLPVALARGWSRRQAEGC